MNPRRSIPTFGEETTREVGESNILLFCHRSSEQLLQITHSDDRDDHGRAEKQQRGNGKENEPHKNCSGHAVRLLPRALLSGQADVFAVS